MTIADKQSLAVDKVRTMDEAVELVADGDVLGIHGTSVQGSPMAFFRQLIRARRRRLHIVTLGGSMGVDWLAATGSLARCTFCVISLERFGLCRSFRHGVESGAIAAEELAETAFYARLEAQARGLPFLPTQGMIGTDLLEVGNDNIELIDDPFDGKPVVACKALRLDVAVVHAHRADRFGNVAIDPSVRYPTMTLMPQAADRVIITAEEIVPTDELRRAPDRTVIPGFAVDAVVPVRFGAHPTSLFPQYTYDAAMHEEWAGVRSRSAIDEFLADNVYRHASHDDYLGAMGPARLTKLTEERR
ncbi:hypothetical protein OG563_47425 [Nocardia vinacea]|uniref:CoA transferase subunit A n=1 Tax=Nocardia vinacea TaxID=96468 RepID=A0ABZ1YTT8_9NOCA|nr:CoA-transferase [Nocardia vinacea]